MKKKIIQLVLLLAALTFTHDIFAQNSGVISGQVLDAQTAEPMFGVTAIIRSLNKYGRTDVDGNYDIAGVPDGEYQVEFIMQGMDTQKKKVTVTGGKARANVAMGVKKLETVVVEDRALNDSESSLLKFQKKSAAVSDGISAQAINKTPDSSAGDVIRRVTGITLVGGRFVFVRGLGERYSNTLLNNVPLPSTEPNKRIVPLDLFPASLIKNIIVSKTFIPEEPGEFAGGTVKIETKEYPEEFFVKVGIQTGYNNNTTFQNFKTYSGGGQDWLGLSEGNRKRPDIVTALPGAPFKEVGFGQYGYNSKLITAGSLQFSNQWSPSQINAPMNTGFNFSTGNKFDLGGEKKFGTLFAITYNNDFQFRDEADSLNRAGGVIPGVPIGGANTKLIPFYNYNQKWYVESVNWGAILNNTLQIAAGHRIHFKNFLSVNNDKEVLIYNGNSNASGQTIGAQKLNYIMRNLFTTQLGGDHIFHILGKDTKLDWRVSQSEARRDQPDMRDTIYAVNSTQYGSAPAILQGGTLGSSQFWSNTVDVNRFAGADYEIPFSQWDGLQSKLKVGYSYLDRTRSFNAERYFFREATGGTNLAGGQLPPPYYPLPPEVVYNPVNRGSQGYFVDDATQPTDKYDAKQKLSSYYTQVDMPLHRLVRFVGGLRYENNFQAVKTTNPFDPNAEFFDRFNYKSYLNAYELSIVDPTFRKPYAINANQNVLPAANFIFSPNDKTNVRASYSETLARPDFREMAPFQFFNILGGGIEVGNQYLTRTYIHNYDLRYEFYPKSDEVIAIGVFDKQMASPIEKVMEVDSQFRYTYTNAQSAYVRGVEFEARKSLDMLHEKMQRWSVGINTFFIKSEVSFNDWIYYQVSGTTQRPTNLSRPLQGQSPYVYNVNLRYRFDEKGDHSITLLYNEFGPRINAVGGLGMPDTYERPVGMFDITYVAKFFEKLDIKLSGKNLNDARIKIVQENPIMDSLGGTHTTTNGFNIGSNFVSLGSHGYKGQTINSYRLGPTFTFSATYTFN
ncbi:TonB-dependent receptor [Leptospira langatensis]|uniref:TonB-dependent receptor n=1 Tax=Leptospira langatensis TaxID=2484983 RepID=A0A5F1ZMS3_9LEPT|nr:TonB-dependent receptor [Leptospira langatensis]TGK05137.1 TonB-dependent receptor [Leptospira langatensis]TGL38274.1 TonB-dependent receptor [Leptospira langatensis]